MKSCKDLGFTVTCTVMTSALSLSFSSSAGDAVQVIECCITLIIDWPRAKELKLCPGKTAILLLGGPSNWLEGNLPGLDRVIIPLKDQVCSLGLLLDLALPKEAQTLTIVKSAFYQLWLIAHLHAYLDEECLGLLLKTVQKLQQVQNGVD